MKKQLLLFLTTLLVISTGFAQSVPSISINECYQLAEQHYPLIRRFDLITKTTDYTIENLKKGYLPQLTIKAQATYQSAVTTVPINVPGVDIPSLSKDQYKAYAEINQVIYDGGEIALQKKLQKSNEAISKQQLAADLYQLKGRINQLFFGALLIDEQLQQNVLLASDLQLGLKKMQAAVQNGVAFRSNADLISAELLNTKQRAIELKALRKAYTDMLSLFTGKSIDEVTQLTRPEPITVSSEIKRPELNVYEAQRNSIDVQNKLLAVSTRPKLGLFLQGGYGRPGLDMLNNDFASYYIGGVNFTWSPSNFYTIKRKREQLNINRQEIAVQKETFLFNTELTVKQQSAEINKFQDLLETDDEIIQLRERVKTAAMAQLENGVITSNDFLKEVNDEDQAKQNKMLHRVQLLMAQYNQQTTTGNQP